VVNREEAANLVKDNPINFLRTTRSEIEMPDSVNAYDKSVYEKAKENFHKLVQEAMIHEEEPKLYIYHLTMGEQKQVGIAATFSVDDYDNDIIKKHEKTRRVKEDDRTNHIITTEAQTGAVFLTYKGIDEVNQMVSNTMENSEALYDFTTEDGIIHKLWILPKEYEEKIINEIGKSKYLYIADGHHRAASAARARNVKKETNPNHTGEEEYNFFMAVLFPAEQLKILPYNRVVFDLKGMTEEEFVEKVKANFTIEETSSASPSEVRNICMYMSGKWTLLKPNENVKKTEDVGGNLDVSILLNYILQPILDVQDIRTDTNVDFIGGIRGTKELERLVDSGKAKVAFSMYPVSVEDLINISDAGETMPPKSTWFEPKLRDGLVIHII
jgi:uncharacterized protein (DUF1015 family)